MTQTEIEKLVKKQRDFFNSGETLNVSFRISALEKLRACIIKYEKKINQAIRADLGKSAFESYMCETGQSPSINPNANTAVLLGRELNINPLRFIKLNLRFKNSIKFLFSKIR